uniref:28S ribosomal protein S6, mitochondrial isoform X2 n=1 Tax=Urocitellus parryii TaxID=9999 RepID=UPI000E559A4F|nr:28S ribosomal protein S6, mitochondrial isoform X2 [Urocitellus parryii]
MPRYELALILKAMQRPETAAALKRTIEALMDKGAIVRNLENLGERVLPYKIFAHSQQHRKGGSILEKMELVFSTVGQAQGQKMPLSLQYLAALCGISWWIFMHQQQLLTV